MFHLHLSRENVIFIDPQVAPKIISVIHVILARYGMSNYNNLKLNSANSYIAEGVNIYFWLLLTGNLLMEVSS